MKPEMLNFIVVNLDEKVESTLRNLIGLLKLDVGSTKIVCKLSILSKSQT